MNIKALNDLFMLKIKRRFKLNVIYAGI
jgi:hypothetical protein